MATVATMIEEYEHTINELMPESIEKEGKRIKAERKVCLIQFYICCICAYTSIVVSFDEISLHYRRVYVMANTR